MFYIFLVLSCGGFAPRKKSLIFANHVFFIYLYIVIYFFFMYLFKFIYIYLYIYVCIYICVCVMFCIYIYNYVYIYISVCGGGGCLKMRCPFFLSKNPFRNQKKTPRFETYPCIYNILLFWHVFFVSILCRFVQSKIYVFWFSFVFSFFSIILSEKCIKPKNV